VRARAALVLLVSSLAVLPLLAQARLNKQDADRFHAKLVKIEAYAAAPPRGAKGLTTAITDTEVNAYLRYDAGAQVPVGIAEPMLKAAGNGRVSGTAIVDLDAVRKQKQRGWMDPMGYLTGRLPVSAAGTLTTANGTGRFQLESAEISGVTIPKAVLQELLSYYSRTPQTPSGINMDDPFQLPARIKEIRVGQGTASIVQ